MEGTVELGYPPTMVFGLGIVLLAVRSFTSFRGRQRLGRCCWPDIWAGRSHGNDGRIRFEETTLGYDLLGTCRMGDDPRRSVVDGSTDHTMCGIPF